MNNSCGIELQALNNSLQECLQNFTDLQASTNAALLGICAPNALGVYNQGLHIVAIFVVLIASMTGALFPILMKYHPGLHLDKYYICLGKCVGIGVILACALVHMLQPASQSLTAPCLPLAFNTVYPAYAFMYCMLSVLGMHFFDYVMEEYMTQHMLSNHQGEDSTKMEKIVTEKQEDSSVDMDTQKDPSKNEREHGHVHSLLLIKGIHKTISAYLLEFGVTIHSVFIGLENGIVPETELKTLMVALCFHQLFEGIALGSRIADANLPSHWHEFLLSFIFSIAAPIGITVGVGVTTTLNPSGETFLLVQGTFDAVCSGILLYIGLLLLLKDFPEDLKEYCGSNKYKKMGMFFALYVGAGLMAFIGKYL